MPKKQLYIFIALCLYLFISLPLFSQVSILEFGGEHGWQSFLHEKNIQRLNGRFGYESIAIASASEKIDDRTDMFLSFEDNTVKDDTENYHIASSTLSVEQEAKMGRYCALSRGAAGGIRLEGSKNALFGSSGLIGSFSISFWLKPSLCENGESVFLWRSSRTVNYKPLYQMISAAFFNNKIEWQFTNIFSSLGVDKSDYVISSSQLIIPNRWAHHTLNFNEESGLLEYYIDGRLENLRYITSDGTSSGLLLASILGIPSTIELCSSFTGFIDDFRIQKDSKIPLRYHPLFIPEGGSFETEIVGPYRSGTAITSVESVKNVKDETEIQIFIRGAEDQFGWDSKNPKWIPIKDGVPIEPVLGQWFQLGVYLYSDGIGSISPTLTSVKIITKESEPPLPPFSLFSTAGDGWVRLNWLPSVDNNADGYFLYYGEAPGEYLGREAIEGFSPLDIGDKISCTLTGLKNGKIYYFAVSSYSSKSSKVEGVLSKELWARPLRNMP